MQPYHLPPPPGGDMTPEQVKALRDALGLKQREFAACLGVRPSTVSDWETGKVTPNVHLVRFAVAIVEASQQGRIK